MFPQRRIDRSRTERDGAVTVAVLPAQFAELLETVFACERAWRLEDRIDVAVRYGARR